MKDPWSVDQVEFPKIVMTFGNIQCTFYWQGKNRLDVYKGSDAQVYDPANLEVPCGIYKKMYRQALAILNERLQRREKTAKTQQLILPFKKASAQS